MSRLKPHIDPWLLVSFILLLCIGLGVLYSASTVESYNHVGNTSFYFVRQLQTGLLFGLVGMVIATYVDYRKWLPFIPFFVIFSLILLLLVKVPGISLTVGGATRWIHIGSFVFQPSELAKLVIILYLAAWLSRKSEHLSNFYYGVFPALVTTGLFALLILWQPDMGTMMIVVAITLAMLYVGGVSLKRITYLVGGGGLGFALLIWLEPYRIRRVLTFFNPAHDPLGIGYQINQAMLAIGAGGLWGYGYGLSRQKYNYLPEALSDSIFAVMAEELGFIRVVLILALFAFFCIRGVYIAYQAPDMFGKLLGTGIIIWLGLQVVINAGAMMGLLPLTGITLPLFSHGSSSLLVTLVGIGLLFNISRQRQSAKRA
jgi:cell division protein FtsW